LTPLKADVNTLIKRRLVIFHSTPNRRSNRTARVAARWYTIELKIIVWIVNSFFYEYPVGIVNSFNLPYILHTASQGLVIECSVLFLLFTHFWILTFWAIHVPRKSPVRFTYRYKRIVHFIRNIFLMRKMLCI
jgi:hypothetical protein